MEQPASVEEPPVGAAEEPVGAAEDAVAAVKPSSAVYIDGVLTVIHSKPKEVLISVPIFAHSIRHLVLLEYSQYVINIHC